MKHQHRVQPWIGAFACMPLFLGSQAISQSSNHTRAVETASVESVEQKGQFIAAFEWSVVKTNEYVWPFESIRPAPYQSVRMLVVQMPRAWSHRGRGKTSVALSAYRTLMVNGNALPKPQPTTGSREDFRLYLEKGRLRFSFSIPSGFKLDPQNAIVRIKLYQVD